MNAPDERLLGSQRQISDEMRMEWIRADIEERRHRMVVRVLIAAVLIVVVVLAKQALG